MTMRRVPLIAGLVLLAVVAGCSRADAPDAPRTAAPAFTANGNARGAIEPARRGGDVAVTAADRGGEGRLTAAMQVAIGGQLLRRHLSRFTSAATPETERLSGFRFDENDLNLMDGTEHRLVFRARFAVLPTSPEHSAWWAGNGRQGEGNWIVDKTMFLIAVKEGNVWRACSPVHHASASGWAVPARVKAARLCLFGGRESRRRLSPGVGLAWFHCSLCARHPLSQLSP